MLCDNCGKREANVRYSENINGVKKELNLCEECSQKLGINNIDFSMPLNFSSFFGEFMDDFTTSEFMPLIDQAKKLKCDSCGYTFDDIVNTGKLGCGNCYDVFSDKMEPIINRIQGSTKHIGRMGKILDNKIKYDIEDNQNKEISKIEKLQEDLKQAIKQERYEDAAKIRDEIKKIEKGE